MERVGDFVICIFEFSQILRIGPFDFIYFIINYFYYKNMRGNKMTFPKYKNIEDLIKKSNKIYFGVFRYFYLNLGKMRVHFIGLDFRSPGKFIS